MSLGPTLSVIIPTQRRPGGLETALRSIEGQVGAPSFELIIVDNDQGPSAQGTVAALAARASFPVIYVHEPKPGVANARNAAVSKASGEFIAFLDDDEEAPAHWLSALVAAQSRFAADVVFGPVRGRAPTARSSRRAYLEWFFSRLGPEETQVLETYYGCGDSLIRRAAMPDPVQPFSVLRNHTGGEDDLLFGQMQARGAVFAWAPEAWVWEDPLPQRLTLRYTIRRAFAYGQGPSEACAAQTPADYWGVARWMVVGLVQAGAYGVLAVIQRLTGSKSYLFALDRAARGLGKTLWWRPFKMEFYGHSV